jgi:hypothetical protein
MRQLVGRIGAEGVMRRLGAAKEAGYGFAYNPPYALHRQCQISRDFVPWRFLDAGRHSAWRGRHAGVQKPAQTRTYPHILPGCSHDGSHQISGWTKKGCELNRT